MIYKRGAVQLRASYLDDDKSTDLKYSLLQRVYSFLSRLLSQVITYSHEANYEIIIQENKPVKKLKIPNMVDGMQPKMCHNRPGTAPGSGDYRPVPYSFYGVCPMEGYYVKGIKRSDGKYEPCCRKLKTDPNSPDYIGRYKDILLNGYPDSLAQKYNETITPGDSAVYVPGTKIIEPRSFPGLNNMELSDLKGCLENSGYLRDSTVFEKGYKARWTYEVFEIKSVDNSIYPNSYILVDLLGDSVDGIFYDAELQKTAVPNIRIFEKVVHENKKGNKYEIKFKEYDDERFNKVVSKKELDDIKKIKVVFV
jgi:hypothetical protein